jgi:hypothetical protein
MTDTIPTRAQLDHETLLDGLLIAHMREEAAVEFVRERARRVFRWANLFGFVGLPLICLIAFGLINLRWPL